MRLQKRDKNVAVWVHLFGNSEGVFCIFFFRNMDPFAPYNSRSVFNAYKRTSVGTFRNEDRSGFTHRIGLLVGGEREHGNSARVGFVGATAR